MKQNRQRLDINSRINDLFRPQCCAEELSFLQGEFTFIVPVICAPEASSGSCTLSGLQYVYFP